MKKSTLLLITIIWLCLAAILKLIVHDIHGADIYAVGVLIVSSIHTAYTDLKK